MARPGLNQHAGVGGAPGELLGVDLRRGLQPEGVSMFAPRQRATRRQIALQGGVQALSRSHFAKIIPPEKSGEYFGLFDICGKGASFLGTMIVSVGSQLTGSANVGIGMLALLFAVGFVLFRVSCRTEGAKQV